MNLSDLSPRELTRYIMKDRFDINMQNKDYIVSREKVRITLEVAYFVGQKFNDPDDVFSLVTDDSNLQGLIKQFEGLNINQFVDIPLIKGDYTHISFYKINSFKMLINEVHNMYGNIDTLNHLYLKDERNQRYNEKLLEVRETYHSNPFLLPEKNVDLKENQIANEAFQFMEHYVEPSVQGLEFIRVFMRLDLQADARAAHIAFTQPNIHKMYETIIDKKSMWEIKKTAYQYVKDINRLYEKEQETFNSFIRKTLTTVPIDYNYEDFMSKTLSKVATEEIDISQMNAIDIYNIIYNKILKPEGYSVINNLILQKLFLIVPLIYTCSQHFSTITIEKKKINISYSMSCILSLLKNDSALIFLVIATNSRNAINIQYGEKPFYAENSLLYKSIDYFKNIYSKFDPELKDRMNQSIIQLEQNMKKQGFIL